MYAHICCLKDPAFTVINHPLLYNSSPQASSKMAANTLMDSIFINQSQHGSSTKTSPTSGAMTRDGGTTALKTVSSKSGFVPPAFSHENSEANTKAESSDVMLDAGAVDFVTMDSLMTGQSAVTSSCTSSSSSSTVAKPATLVLQIPSSEKYSRTVSTLRGVCFENCRPSSAYMYMLAIYIYILSC